MKTKIKHKILKNQYSHLFSSLEKGGEVKR